MGRRKIEIRAIKDDRNRSVTFLKRKGGLFKKAHELSVLCSVDVAVVIFGHNKKLYEFSSGDIHETLRKYQYYGPPHEHKGPADFKNKTGGGDDDDDEDDEGEEAESRREESVPPQPNMMPPHLQHHNSFQHIRPPTSSASPPMPNGMFAHGHPAAQAAQMDSRPSSRNTIRRTSSNIVPMQHPHGTPTPPQNGFAYAPNPPIYQPQNAGPPPQPSPQPPFQQFQQPQAQGLQPPPPQQQPQQQQPPPLPSTSQPAQQRRTTPPLPQQPRPHPQVAHLQQQFMQEPRRQPAPSQNGLHPPPQPIPRISPQPDHQSQTSLRPPSPPVPSITKHSKSHSIFTPIDEGGSMLARHFFGAPDPPKREDLKQSPPNLKPPLRTTSQPTANRAGQQPPRPASTTNFPPPQRSDTGGSKSGARPKLNLQIPSEASDTESGSGSPKRSAGPSANPERHGGIVLPPPSPSASALLSAGASGPPNPFARPAPPTSNNNNNNNNNYTENRNTAETPISALPSRYMEQSLIASPGGLFSDWDNWGRGMNSAVLPSPLTFPTPEATRGPGFGRVDHVGDEKRKADSELAGEAKKVKT